MMSTSQLELATILLTGVQEASERVRSLLLITEGSTLLTIFKRLKQASSIKLTPLFLMGK